MVNYRKTAAAAWVLHLFWNIEIKKIKMKPRM